MAVEISRQSLSSGKFWVGGNYTANQTNLVLLAAPGAGRAVFIDFVHFTSAAANTVELRDGSGGAAVYRSVTAGAANESTTMPVPLGLTANTALCLNTSYNGNGQFLVLVHIETLR